MGIYKKILCMAALAVFSTSAAYAANLRLEAAVIVCDTCNYDAEYETVISNHYNTSSFFKHGVAKSGGRYTNIWEKPYTVVNSVTKEAQLITYRFIEMNDPEAGIYYTDEGFTYDIGNTSTLKAAMYDFAEEVHGTSFDDEFRMQPGSPTYFKLTDRTLMPSEFLENPRQPSFQYGLEMLVEDRWPKLSPKALDGRVPIVLEVEVFGGKKYRVLALLDQGELVFVAESLSEYIPEDDVWSPTEFTGSVGGTATTESGNGGFGTATGSSDSAILNSIASGISGGGLVCKSKPNASGGLTLTCRPK